MDANALLINVDYKYDEIKDRNNSKYGRYKNKSKQECKDRNKIPNYEYQSKDCVKEDYEKSGGGARCFAGIKINYNGKNVYVYNSHFLPQFMNLLSSQKPTPKKDTSKLNIFRLGQLNEIMEHFNNINDSNKVGIIAGDFNTTYEKLKNNLNTLKDKYTLFNSWKYNHNDVITGLNRKMNMDYIITNNAEYTSTLYDKINKLENLSDHLPVLSHVKIR
jgi:hypothetical protein